MITLLVLVVLLAAEIAAFIKVGAWIGVGWTLLLTLAAVVAGVYLLQRQAFSALARAQAKITQNKAPVRESFEALLIFLGSLLLILPGFVSDTLGILLLIPPLRGLLLDLLQEAPLEALGPGYWAYTYFERRAGKTRGATIEGEFIRLDADKPSKD